MAREIQPKTILVYIDANESEPYTEWLMGLKDQQTIERIRVRIRRLESGLYGDCEAVGKGISELRMFFGSGYRVYFGEEQENIVILLCGGDKSSQKQDIKTAQAYWKDYQDNG
jgi:putative addiction module killer protein